MAGSKPGERRGGRQKGTPNKNKQALLDRIQKKWPGYHPVLALAAVANDETAPLELRMQANKEVAQYVEPKRKAIEMSGQLDSVVRIKDLSGN